VSAGAAGANGAEPHEKTKALRGIRGGGLITNTAALKGSDR